MKKETGIAAIVVCAVAAFLGGYFLGGYNPAVEEGAGHAAGAVGDFDSNILPVGESPIIGAADAKVTVTLFTDLAGASSVQAAADIEAALADDSVNSDNVRVVVKFLPGRGAGRTAAAAALYAADHGNFDGVYDALRENQDSLDDDSIASILEGAGLDQEAFDADDYSAVIDADTALARSLGARSAPAVFVNGHEISRRDLNAAQIRVQINGELSETDRLIGEGSSASQVYALRVRENASPAPAVARNERGERPERTERTERAERPARPAAPAVEARQPRADARPPADDVERLRVPVGNSGVKGADDALITIVEFSDFHCPFCSRVNPTLAALTEQYGDDLRIVFKHNPLPMHPNAPLASRSVMAAGEQGKFWEMHDEVFANQRRTSRSDMESFAQEIGLDMDAFNAYLDAETGTDQIDEDMALARRVGARGTPHFFINGRRLRGAQPVAAFQDIIDSELALARQLMEEEGLERGEVYDHLMEIADEEVQAAAPSQPEQPTQVDPPPVGDSFAKGPDDAPVTVFIFSEFQCPYCSRAQPTMEQIEETYGDQVRFVFKSFPLPFHSDAHLASQAAYAAGEQGKFWEYHDVLFENQRALSRSDLEGYAERLELDMDQFRSALDSGRFSDQVDQEAAEGRAVGVSGTPTFVVNGERIVGAVPFSRFQPVIDRALN